MGTLKKILPLILVLALLCSLFNFQSVVSAAVETTINKSQSLSFKASEKYNENSSVANFSIDLSVPTGYKPKSFQLWMMVADSSGELKLAQQSAGSVTSSKLLLSKINGTKIKVSATGQRSDMYAVINRRSNGKQWVVEGNGVGPYNVTPNSEDTCWSGNLSICPGLLPAKDDNGVTISSNLRSNDGWIKAISDGVDAPVYFTSPIDGSSIYKTALVQSTVMVTKATPLGRAQHRVESKGKGVSGKGQLTVAIPPIKGSTLNDYVCSGCSGNAAAKRYEMQTALDWSAETYYYEGEVRVTYEPIPPANTPTVSCDCSAEPETINFAEKDVPVTATLKASLSGKGTKTVKNWTVYGRANDGSQLTTLTIGYGLDKIEQQFNFTISKTKLEGVSRYTETWVMRARVNFTDGTTAEEPIECSTTVLQPGEETPDPGDGGTPTLPPNYNELHANAFFNPSTIFIGQKSSLYNNSDGYTSFSWKFSSNLAEVLPDTDQDDYLNYQYDKPGYYTATVSVSNGSQTLQATAALQVVDPKPVAIVTGPTKVIQGREFANYFNLYNSYTPLSDQGVTIDFSKNQMRYKKITDTIYQDGWLASGSTDIGFYSIEGKVTDTMGQVSEWGTHTVEVVPDQPPVVEVVVPSETYRFNESMVYIDAQSVDGDTIDTMKLEERFDRDYDGNFEEEAWTTIYSGPYKTTVPISFTSVGKRQYRASVIEDYGLSGTSEIAATNVLNYAPYVDFDVSGLTQQPDQGEGSAPEDAAYTGDSIMRSWKLIKPYSTDTNNPLGWKSDSGSIATKKANVADYFIDYPNMGLGSNGRSKYNLAFDLMALPAYRLPDYNQIATKIYAGHRFYTTDRSMSVSDSTVYVERNADTGAEMRRFTIKHGSGYIPLFDGDKNENFYFGTQNSTSYSIKKFNNQGDLVDTYEVPYTENTFSHDIHYAKITPDGRYIYLVQRVFTTADHNSVQLRILKYDTSTKALLWDAGSAVEAYMPTFYSRYKGTIDNNGDFYLLHSSFLSGWDRSPSGRFQWATLIAVNGTTGVLGEVHEIGFSGTDTSYPVINSSGYIAFTTSEVGYFGDTLSFTMHSYLFNRTTGNLSGDYIGGYCLWCSSHYYTAPDGYFTSSKGYRASTPVLVSGTFYDDKMLFPDSKYDGMFYFGSAGAADYIFSGSSNFYDGLTDPKKGTPRQTNGNIYMMPNGYMAVPTIGASNSYGTGSRSYFSGGISVDGRSPITSTNKYGTLGYQNSISTDPATYLSEDISANGVSAILPDGSYFAYSSTGSLYTPSTGATVSVGNWVMPFVSASGGSTFKPIDDDTVEVTDSNWAGLWYDPIGKYKNDRLSFNVAVNDATNDKIIGAGIHIQDGKNMYAAEWTSSKLTLYKVVSGVKTALKSADITRTPYTTYPFEMEASNGMLRVYINHSKVIEIADSTYQQGSVGVMSLGQQQAKFSDMKLKNYGDYYIEETYQSVLVDEDIKYDTLFDDIEHDPEAKESWSYQHDLDYFANSLGLSQYDGKTFDTALPSLEKPGLYKITYMAKDDPGNEDYARWSEPVTKQLYVHRRPIAQPDVRFTGTVYPEGESLDYLTYDASYDPDIPDYLADRLFRYRWADQTTWTNGKHELYDRPGVELIIQEQVQDGFGVWSYWAETRVYKDAMPPANQHRPQMLITNPTGTAASPTVLASEPTLKWTYQDEDHDPQEQFYLKVSYVDNGAKIMEGTYPGNDTSFILDEGIQQGRKVKVQGRVYSKGYWSDDSNIVYFILNTPPVTHLLSFNGSKASEPIYTNNNRPLLKVSVADVDGQPVSKIDYEVFYNATSALVVDTNNAISTTSYTPAALQEGLHNWHARANDSMAWGGYSENGYFFVDTVPPDDTNEQLDIKPTSVTVSFNPFSDATPSSGHASRAFYMQKVNDDGTTTNIDLNGNGTAEYSIAIPNTKTSYTVTGLVTGQRYRLMVVDWDVAGNMGQYQYIYFTTNRPPTADFDWSPKPVYEGDTAAFTTTVNDPDGNNLSITYKLTSPSGVIKTFAYTFKSPYPSTGPTYRMTEAGEWTMKLTVSDGMETVQTEKKVKVMQLGLTGYVKHTDQWDEYRKEFNKKQSGSESSPRGDNVFWAGEKFLLSAVTTDTGTATKADRVEVAMKSYSAALASVNVSRSSWQGELWDTSFPELKKGPLSFEFTAYYNNGIVKRETVTVQIEGNMYDIVGVHRLK